MYYEDLRNDHSARCHAAPEFVWCPPDRHPSFARALVHALARFVNDSGEPPLTWNNMPEHWYEAYERGRPGYPPEVVNISGMPSPATVLDLGAGTGKLTRLLVSKFVRVVAIEPDDQMRRRLTALCPEAEALAGSAEQIPLPNDSVDAVFAAQSFHWFANEPALAEIARILRPRGTLVLLWNLPAGRTEPSLAAVEQLLQPHWPKGWDLPLDLGLSGSGHGSDDWRLAFAQSVFEELQETRLPNPQTVHPEELVAFFGSMGWIATLPDEERLSLLEKVRALLTATEYRLPWQTRVYRTRLAQLPEGERVESGTCSYAPLELVRVGQTGQFGGAQREKDSRFTMTTLSNLFTTPPSPLAHELIEPLIATTSLRLERIVSLGHVTPPGEWYDQDLPEWVVLLSGGATLRFEDEAEPIALRPGDHLLIAAHRRHRVEWTDPNRHTVWLALHYRDE